MTATATTLRRGTTGIEILSHKWRQKEETAFIEGSVDMDYERIVNDVRDFVEQTKRI